MGWLQSTESNKSNSCSSNSTITKSSNSTGTPNNPNTSSSNTLNQMKTIHEKIKYLQSLSERDKNTMKTRMMIGKNVNHYGSVDNLYQELDELESCTCDTCDNFSNDQHEYKYEIEQQQHCYESIYGRQYQHQLQRHYNNNPTITNKRTTSNPSSTSSYQWIQDGVPVPPVISSSALLSSCTSNPLGLFTNFSSSTTTSSASNPMNNSCSGTGTVVLEQFDSSQGRSSSSLLRASDDSARFHGGSGTLQYHRDQVRNGLGSQTQTESNNFRNNIIDSRSLRRNSTTNTNATTKHKGPNGILNRRLSSDLNAALSSSTLSLSRLDILEEEQSLTCRTATASKKKSERSSSNIRNPNTNISSVLKQQHQQQLNGIWLDSRNRRELISQESCPHERGLFQQQKSSSSRILSPHRIPSSKRSSTTSSRIHNSITGSTKSQRNNCCLDVLQLQQKNPNSTSSPSKSSLHHHVTSTLSSSNNSNSNANGNVVGVIGVPTVSGLICSSPQNHNNIINNKTLGHSYSYELNEYCICPTSSGTGAAPPLNSNMSTNLNIRDFDSPNYDYDNYEEISKIYQSSTSSPQRSNHYPHKYLQHVIMNTSNTSSRDKNIPGFGFPSVTQTPSPRKIVPKQSYKPGIYLPSSCLVDKDEIYDYIPPMKEPESLSPSKSTPRRLKLQKSNSNKNPVELLPHSTSSSSTLYNTATTSTNTNRKSKVSSPSHQNLDSLISAENSRLSFEEGRRKIQIQTGHKTVSSGSSSTNRTFISLSKLGRRLGLGRLFRSFRIQSRGTQSQTKGGSSSLGGGGKQSNQTNNGNISTLIIKSRNGPNGSCGKGLSSTDVHATTTGPGNFVKGSVSCSGPIINGMSSLPSNERIIETINRLKYEELQKRKERIAQEHLKFKDLTSEEFLQQAQGASSISTSTGNNTTSTSRTNGKFSPSCSFIPQETSSFSTNRTNQIKYKTNSNSNSSSKRQIDLISADGKFSSSRTTRRSKNLECETDGSCAASPFHYSLGMVETEKIQLENSEGQTSRASTAKITSSSGKIGQCQYSYQDDNHENQHQNQPTNSSSNSSLSLYEDQEHDQEDEDEETTRKNYDRKSKGNHHSKSLDSESPFHRNKSNGYSTRNHTQNGYSTTERCNSNCNEIDYDFHSPKSILDLLRSINLEKYTSLLIGHGFESIELFQELEEEDLDHLEIQNQNVRGKLLDTVKRLRQNNNSRSSDTPNFLIIPTYSCPSQMNLLQEQTQTLNQVGGGDHLNQIIEPPPDFNRIERMENPKPTKLEIRQGIIRSIEPLDDHVEELILSPSNLSINQINPIDSQALISRRNQRINNYRSFNGTGRYVNITDSSNNCSPSLVSIQHSKSSSEPSPSGNENSSCSQNNSLLNELKNQALLCDKSSDSGISVGANSPPPTN